MFSHSPSLAPPTLFNDDDNEVIIFIVLNYIHFSEYSLDLFIFYFLVLFNVNERIRCPLQ